MTTVIVYKNSSKQYMSFVCMGHAGYAKKRLFSREPDILCSAISMLVINTINSLEVLCGELENMVQTINEETGFIKCEFKESISKEKSVVLLDAMVLGLTELSKQYGAEYLQVKFEEV